MYTGEDVKVLRAKLGWEQKILALALLNSEKHKKILKMKTDFGWDKDDLEKVKLKTKKEKAERMKVVYKIRYWEKDDGKSKPIPKEYHDCIMEIKKNIDEDIVKNGFWNKIAGCALDISNEVRSQSTQLYKIGLDKSISSKERYIALGALAYLIMPLDAIPDMIPLTGYIDDIGVIGIAVNQLKKIITQEIKEEADKDIREKITISIN